MKPFIIRKINKIVNEENQVPKKSQKVIIFPKLEFSNKVFKKNKTKKDGKWKKNKNVRFYFFIIFRKYIRSNIEKVRSRKNVWTNEEQNTFKRLHSIHGNKWSLISKFILQK